EIGERLQQQRYRQAGAALDERVMPVAADQVARRHARAMLRGVEADDAVVQWFVTCHRAIFAQAPCAPIQRAGARSSTTTFTSARRRNPSCSYSEIATRLSFHACRIGVSPRASMPAQTMADRRRARPRPRKSGCVHTPLSSV